MLAPNLYIPFLGVHSNGKFIFGTCASCVKKEQKSFCNHTIRERQMTETWTTIEIEHAVRHGYRILKIHEIVCYSESLPMFEEFYRHLARIKVILFCELGKKDKIHFCGFFTSPDFQRRV